MEDLQDPAVPSRPEVPIPGYEIHEILGRGSFADVWSAVRNADGAGVALKVLRASADEDARLRFAREVSVARTIDSPHTCRVIDADVRGNGARYIAYERLVGETLEKRLERDDDLSLGETLAIVDDVLGALVAAHGAGVIHRDVKPANIFLEGGDAAAPRGRLLDFGVAKVEKDREGDFPIHTTRGSTLGSLAYMAPEQATGESQADGRTDLYALGVVTFRALVGRPPFAAQSPATLLALKLDRDAPRLGDVSGMRWPAAVETFVKKLLARLPEARFPSAKVARVSCRDLSAKLAKR